MRFTDQSSHGVTLLVGSTRQVVSSMLART
jgi:hypothetical protein